MNQGKFRYASRIALVGLAAAMVATAGSQERENPYKGLFDSDKEHDPGYISPEDVRAGVNLIERKERRNLILS